VKTETTHHRASDPTLSVIAKRLSTLAWASPLTEEEKLTAVHCQKDFAAKRHLVVMMPDFKTWAVRMYLAGAQRTLGHCQGDIEPALRFADMARMFFWPYRVRGCAEPTDVFLNFSVARAQNDLQYETEARAMLEDTKNHLLKIGALSSSEDREQLRREAREKRAKLRTLRGEILGMHDVWLNRLGAIESKLEKKLDALERKQGEMLELFNRILAAAKGGTS